MSTSRREYLLHNRSASAWAALDDAANAQMQVTREPCMPERDSLNGKHVVILGSGVGGLTTAYELLARNSDVKVTILEARDRTGGRCLTLRTGDTLTEDKDSALKSARGTTQSVRFEHPLGDSEPYLNAGPGRIPSSHKRLLDYLQRFGVALEVYVMGSESNLTQMHAGPNGDKPMVNRQLTHNTRGWIAEMVYKNADLLIDQLLVPSSAQPTDQSLGDEDAAASTTANADDANARALMVNQLRSLMVNFGDLSPDGVYKVGVAKPGEDDTLDVSDRAGFKELPGVRPGLIAEAISLDRLLASEYWEKTRFYQLADFLWQQTLFQPVGGMDQVQHAFVKQIAILGGVVHLNSPVTNIQYDRSSQQFVIDAEGHDEPFRADYCFSNIAIPFLETILSAQLQGDEGGFSNDFKEALRAVYKAQTRDDETQRFLATTTKVGWQAERSLWQGKSFVDHMDNNHHVVLTDADDEVGTVPIYGGISWTDHSITQIWYPSYGYHDKMGVLTGCYNFGGNASHCGQLQVEERLAEARAGAERFGKAFANGLKHGVAIAWQNMRYIKGGWAQWTFVDNSVQHYNTIIQGTGVDGADAPSFFVVGDQVSSLPGWQEGAIASALNALSRLARPDLKLPHLAVLPDTRLMVEGL